MKIDPLSIILKTDFKIDKKFYFISGNETTLIQKINTKIVSTIKEEGGVALIKVDAIGEYVDETSFFEEKKIVLVKSCKDLNEKSLNRVRDTSDVFVFVQENSSKIKKRVDINVLLNKVRLAKKKEKMESTIFFGLITAVIVVTGIIVSI